MCGIAGIVDLKSRPVDRAPLQKMCDLLEHRGPDDQGFYVHCSAALGQRRLSIIDLSSGQQPMSNEDGTVWVTFNGEIYNFQQLRQELLKRGHTFKTNSDTETVVHAYEEYGDDCVHHFRGMFAFGIWDQNRKRLLLARDRTGKKPIYYTVVDGQFLFASELQSLVSHPAVKRDIAPTSIDDYLTYGYIPAPQSIYKNVHKLPPAHLLTLAADDPAGSQTRRYWQLEYEPKLEVNDREAVEGLREVLTEAVRLRMISDVPIGALLSGGVDSSVVVAIMSQLASGPVETFSIGFADQQFNETKYARMVAERYGTKHHELIVEPNAVEILPKLIRHYGEPYSDSSAVPSYYVSQLTRQHVTVALNGDGGDESFAGYDRYLGSKVAERYKQIPAVLRRRMIEPLLSLVPNSLPRNHRLRQARRFVSVAAQPIGSRYSRWVSIFPPSGRKALYTPEFAEQISTYHAEDWFLQVFDEAQKRCSDPVDALLALDIDSYLPFDLLVKMDIASMANSLETRSPLLDQEVMAYAARLPANMKIRGRTLKYLLKELGGQLLPRELLHRRKMGFGVPLARWFRNELRPMLEDVVLSDQALQRGYVNPDVVRTYSREHLEEKTDHSFQLWSLLCLELWHREFQD
jgi:asparagine synthase (glutamine-hydrolysing)